MITIDERYHSREGTEGNNLSVELLYIVQGTDDDEAVKDLVADTAPATYDGLERDSFSVVPVGGGVWECTVRYVPAEGTSQFSFDTGGGTQHISQSLLTRGIYAAPGEIAPVFQGAIGVNHDQIEGVDVVVPVYNFAETHTLSPLVVTGAYKGILFLLTGKVNAAAFKGFARGEVLFLGASGAKRGSEDWEISFRFAASPNVANLQLNNIGPIAKEGWNYLWVRFADEEDNVAKVLIKKPIAAYVEQVYEYGDFSALGIGT